MTEFERMWHDQAAFNKQLREPPNTPEEMTAVAKDFVLYIESELHELLRLFQWKGHRRGDVFENAAHRYEELADAFKCFMSLAQYCGMTPDDLYKSYWLKSAVVRQRYQEEWLGSLTRPCAVVDIDNVLCNYVDGICNWIGVHSNAVPPERVDFVRSQRLWTNASAFGLQEEQWQKLKHEFRVSGAKRHLPLFNDARPFLKALRRRNLQIILLTSRPIDRYPNMYTDTLAWLQSNDLTFDYIWWAHDKAERVIEAEIRPHIRLIVDDDMKYISQYAKADLQSYWLQRTSRPNEVQPTSPLIHPASNLQQVVDHYDSTIKQQEAATW